MVTACGVWIGGRGVRSGLEGVFMARQRVGAVSFAVLLLLCSAAAAVHRPDQPAGKGPAAAAGAGVQDLLIGGDTNKRYFLIGPETAAQASGYKLLVVLPGGDGSENFQEFVKNIAAKGLPPGYIVAQAVAPKWSDAENRIVWPIAKLPDAKANFTTEELVEAIIADVKGKHAIDPKCVFTLGWSSGGPPCYAVALKEGSPVTGSFVAMSVFKPEVLPPLENGKGKAFYILHSPTDFIKMSFPEAAKEKLAAAGAMTKLVTYPGGHGWQGDVFGTIRAGVEWMEGAGK
jgi:predicted esterase